MMDVVRRKSERVRVRKSVFTSGKTINRKQHQANPQNSKEKSTDYERNKRKTVGNKLESSERTFTVKPEIWNGNLILIFSAAAYEEFKVITQTVLQNSGHNIDRTDTKEKAGLTVSESLAIRKDNVKTFVLNFYNTTTKVLLNG